MNLRDTAAPAAEVVRALGLLAHPEGGHFRETWRDQPDDGSRGAGTAILFLLAAGEVSHWHRVDADELWLWQAGAPLLLRRSAVGGRADGRTVADSRLGPDLAAGEALQLLVPRRCWQSAASLGAWSLVSCVVAPAFRFAGFELAAAGWRPTAD